MAVLAHVGVRTTIRPPRAVILFRGDENWRRWARLALISAGNNWAGGGHLLVPYSPDGNISQQMLKIVEHFDPDHILLLELTIREQDWALQGDFPVKLDGKYLGPAERDKFIAEHGGTPGHTDGAGLRARRLLEQWCTPFFEVGLEDNPDSRRQRRGTIRTDGVSGLVTTAMLFPEGPPSHVAVPHAWTSDAALVLGSLWGVADQDEPGEEPDAWDLLGNVPTFRPSDPGSAQFWVGQPNGAPQSRFDLLDQGVSVIQSGWTEERGAVVLGDSADDFALARAYQQLLGYGLWLSPAMFADAEILSRVTAPLVMLKHNAFDQSSETPRYVSTSIADKSLDVYLEKLDKLVTGNFVMDPPMPTNHVKRTDFPDLAAHFRFRAIDDEVDVPSSVAVERDEDATFTMATRYALPSPRKIGFFGAQPAWIVDFYFEDSLMPSGRSIGPELLTVNNGWRDAIVRSGRNGTAVLAGSYGFVAAGAVRSSTLAHPRLASLGMFAWVKTMAADHGFDVRHSTPGLNAQIAARRIGTRGDLIGLVSGSMHPVLKLFAPADASGTQWKKRLAEMSDRERSLQPYRANGEFYVTFEMMSNATGRGSAVMLTEQLDRLANADLIRRGFLLTCADCGRESFVAIDRAGHIFECPRCGAGNTLTSARWGRGVEPPWFYDLHNALRQLMTENGDIPLLAAARLRASTRRYADIGELEFWKDGEQFAEIDLISLVDRSVVVTEAKISATLGPAREARRTAGKIATIARALRADKVLLATNQETWAERDVTFLHEALEGQFSQFPAPLAGVLLGLTPSRMREARSRVPYRIRHGRRRQIRRAI